MSTGFWRSPSGRVLFCLTGSASPLPLTHLIDVLSFVVLPGTDNGRAGRYFWYRALFGSANIFLNSAKLTFAKLPNIIIGSTTL